MIKTRKFQSGSCAYSPTLWEEKGMSEHARPRLQRRVSNVKFGYHMAVGLAKRSSDKGSSTSTPHVIALVGLPARGKTYISKKLCRYLNWIGINTKVFNLGDYRRKVKEGDTPSNDFFSPDNPQGMKIREMVCEEALQDVFAWLDVDGEVAVFDATNTTVARRKKLYDRVVQEKGYKLFFVESICDDDSIVESNIRECKTTNPDYVGQEEKDVLTDFKLRIKHYESQYEPLDEGKEKFSFIKIFNAGEKVVVHKHEGHIQSRIVYYLMNVHITTRSIYLTRHGESEYNISGVIGGDSDLSDEGKEYARRLGEYVNELNIDNLAIWTSWLNRTIQSAEHIKAPQERWKTLNEIDCGVCDSMSFSQVKEKYPEEFNARAMDKFMYRYPMGESYEDLVARLEPIIMELERKENVVVIAHQAVLRCILGYFLAIDEEELPWVEVPAHSVIKLTPVAYGCNMETIYLGPEHIDLHSERPKPEGFTEENNPKIITEKAEQTRRKGVDLTNFYPDV